jgi:hypothetical protein
MKHAKIIAFSSMALGTIACTVEADVDKNVDKAPKAPVTPEMDKDPTGREAGEDAAVGAMVLRAGLRRERDRLQEWNV